MNHRTRGRNSGYTLTEILGVIFLMGSFLLLSTRLFHSSTHVVHVSGEAESTVARFDSAMQLLRADVWNASNIDAHENRSVSLTEADGTTIHWLIDDDNSLVREILKDKQTSTTHRWRDAGAAIRFGAGEPQLIVQVAGEGELRLTSLVQLSRRNP